MAEPGQQNTDWRLGWRELPPADRWLWWNKLWAAALQLRDRYRLGLTWSVGERGLPGSSARIRPITRIRRVPLTWAVRGGDQPLAAGRQYEQGMRTDLGA
jgi:hypothetical protein